MSLAVVLLLLFVIGGTVLLGRTAFGRRIYAVGNSARVAYLSGVNIGATLIGAYVLSGLCAALVGILLAGFNGQASLGMGDEYLLPSIAVVVVGGTLSACALTLVVLPVIYRLYARAAERFAVHRIAVDRLRRAT